MNKIEITADTAAKAVEALSKVNAPYVWSAPAINEIVLALQAAEAAAAAQPAPEAAEPPADA